MVEHFHEPFCKHCLFAAKSLLLGSSRTLEKWLGPKRSVIAMRKLADAEISVKADRLGIERSLFEHIDVSRVIVFATCNRGSEKSPTESGIHASPTLNWETLLARSPRIIESTLGTLLRDSSRLFHQREPRNLTFNREASPRRFSNNSLFNVTKFRCAFYSELISFLRHDNNFVCEILIVELYRVNRSMKSRCKQREKLEDEKLFESAEIHCCVNL